MLDIDVMTLRSLVEESGRELAAEIATDVLIIEDDTFIAMELETLVESLGHRVLGVARTHAEAVALTKKKKPGLILADIQLADGSSGLDAVNDLLKTFEVPVIFITAYPERFLTGERPEPAFLIAKPFQPATVSAIASQALFFERSAKRRAQPAAGLTTTESGGSTVFAVLRRFPFGSSMTVGGQADDEPHAGGDRQRRERAALHLVGEALQGVAAQFRRFFGRVVAQLERTAADRAASVAKAIAHVAQRRGDRIAHAVGRLHRTASGAAARAFEPLSRGRASGARFPQGPPTSRGSILTVKTSLASCRFAAPFSLLVGRTRERRSVWRVPRSDQRQGRLAPAAGARRVRAWS